MILRAERMSTIETPEGIKTIYKGEFFRFESNQVVMVRYPDKPNKVLDEYLSYEKEVFNIEDDPGRR